MLWRDAWSSQHSRSSLLPVTYGCLTRLYFKQTIGLIIKFVAKASVN